MTGLHALCIRGYVSAPERYAVFANPAAARGVKGQRADANATAKVGGFKK